MSGELAKSKTQTSKRYFIDTLAASIVIDPIVGDKAFISLKKCLPQVVDVAYACTIIVPIALVKKQLAELASSSSVFGVMGRVP